MAGCVTTMWVKRPLSVNQHGQLSQPSLQGWLYEYVLSSNPLKRITEVETYCWLARCRLLGHCTGLCVQAFGRWPKKRPGSVSVT